MKNHYINEQIRAKEVRLIDSEGEQVGVVPMATALNRAQEQELDLVMVTENVSPPVCKIIDYGQYRYQQQKKEKLARKSSKAQVIKELKMRPKISDHDFQVRVNKAIEFLKKGYVVKIFVPFRGREIVHPELGDQLIARFLESVEELGKSDQGIIRAPRSRMVMINPK